MSTLSQFVSAKVSSLDDAFITLAPGVTVNPFKLTFCSTSFSSALGCPLLKTVGDVTDPTVGGGTVICASSNVAWIVAPASSQVSRTWYCRDDANTRSQQVSGCTGWFVPTISQLQNPGYICRTYWDSFSSATYWSSTSTSTGCAWATNFSAGFSFGSYGKNGTLCVRSFRCVTY